MTTKTKSRPEDNGQFSTEEARELIMRERQERVEACRTEVEKILRQYRCSINPVVVISGGQVQQQIQFTALE